MKLQSNIDIRPATIDDLPEMLELFADTIANTFRNDYNEDQIKAWISSVEHEKKWKSKLKENYFLIAEYAGKIIGFGSLVKGHYIDLIYVHKEYLRQGIANRLYLELEKEADRTGNHTLYSDVSITARPFFEQQGFVIEKENRNIIKGVEIINFHMKKEK